MGSYAIGTMLGISTRWGGSFSAGVEYQQIINKIKREQTVIERVTVYDEMAYFYLDSNNNKVWVADSVTSTRRYHREIQMKKTHTLVNIPLSLGYHVEYDRWRLGVRAGVNLHLFKEFDGKVLDPSGQVIDAGTGTNFEVYETDMSLSIMGGFDLGYLLGDHLELYVSPRFRYHSESWLNESHPLESYIQLAGLRGGARYHF